MPYCPNCGDEITADVASCPTCEAVFGSDGTWHPVAAPPEDRDPSRIAEIGAATARRREQREREAQKREREAQHKATEAAARQPWIAPGWLLGYLYIVVIAHGVTILAGRSGLNLFVLLYLLAIPFFIPGVFVGGLVFCNAIITKAPDRYRRLIFGLAPLLLPVVEWYLLKTLPSGWAGS